MTTQPRCLSYANCGHHPPLLLSKHGVERLTSTATVLGVFEEWECGVAKTYVAPDDLLAIYTDGVVEATNHQEEEFGEAGLLRTLQATRSRNPQSVLEAVVQAVQDFAYGDQGDDLTLVIAQGR